MGKFSVPVTEWVAETVYQYYGDILPEAYIAHFFQLAYGEDPYYLRLALRGTSAAFLPEGGKHIWVGKAPLLHRSILANQQGDYDDIVNICECIPLWVVVTCCNFVASRYPEFHYSPVFDPNKYWRFISALEDMYSCDIPDQTEKDLLYSYGAINRKEVYVVPCYDGSVSSARGTGKENFDTPRYPLVGNMGHLAHALYHYEIIRDGYTGTPPGLISDLPKLYEKHGVRFSREEVG